MKKDYENEILGFKLQMGEAFPFYGEVLFRVPITADASIPTACTDGKSIWYNPSFFDSLSEGQRNYVLMHEVFHILLQHSLRKDIVEDDTWDLWNIACDQIVNYMVDQLSRNMRGDAGILCERPPEGIFDTVSAGDSAESLYIKLLEAQKKHPSIKKSPGWRKDYILIPVPQKRHYDGKRFVEDGEVKICKVMSDLKEATGEDGKPLSPEEIHTAQIQLEGLIREALQKGRGSTGSYYIPDQCYTLTASKQINWKTLLQDFLEDEIDEETSYATPERKYLHMGLILPGHSLSHQQLEEIWAFVDSSGSVSQQEMNEFLTQLYRITKEFDCKMNIAYWDTAVTDVYREIHSEKDILNCIPHHSGGTAINCVYNWIEENRIKPEIMLILTDGYYGTPNAALAEKYRRKTILVLSSDLRDNENLTPVGKIARLKD